MLKRKSGKISRIIIMVEIICLVLACIGLYVVVERRAEAKRQQAALEEQELQARKEALEGQKAMLKEWNLILVNSEKAMPDDLEVVTADVEDGYVADERICSALKEMLADCRDAGYEPRIISTFRTRETQQYLYDHTANKADTAIPGHSEHECGLAADIVDANSMGWGDPLIDKQEDMPAQKWMMAHCHEYGFVLRYPKDKADITEIIYEPWHYRYVGREHAERIMGDRICLEEYLGRLESGYYV